MFYMHKKLKYKAADWFSSPNCLGNNTLPLINESNELVKEERPLSIR